MKSPDDPGKTALRITSIELPDLARLLSKSTGKSVSVAALQQDLDAGAPANPDGTVNLVHYAAWLVKEVADRGN